jgi:hypothetical protein
LTLFLASVHRTSHGEESNAGLVRRLLAEIRLDYKFARWKTSYLWWIIEIAVVEAYVAWCEYHEQRVPLKNFLKGMVEELVTYIQSHKQANLRLFVK